MHDLSLGPPVPVGRDPNAKHSGSCFDGVYGCHLCWNAANDGKGTESECDWCQKKTLTLVLRSIDEPVLYAICESCQERRARYAAEVLDELDDGRDDRWEDDDD